MNEDSKISQQISGHPRTRGARSFHQKEKNLGGGYPLRFGSVPSFDGTPIFYCVEGEGEPLVFCYGIACSSLHWTYQIDYFRKNYQCIWFDYRGHRHTPIPDRLETLTVDSCALDLKAVLDFLDIPSATLLGHSMGVNVVLEFAHLFPERVKSMILANGTPKRPLETLLGGSYLMPAFGLLSKFEKDKPSLLGNLWKLQERMQFIGSSLGALGFNTALSDPQDIKTYAKQIAELSPTVLTRMMDDYQNLDATPWLHTIKTKTLVLSGDSDLVTPPHTQDLMAQLIPNAELHRIQHGSHCSTLDMPDYINMLIERFIR
jgi:pimeloyl-ACP methyl ester carboxylesterase